MPKIVPLNKQLEDFKLQCFDGSDAKRILRNYNSCVEQTKKFVCDSGFSDVVIGISGGVDSALVAKIAVDAFGKEHVHGVVLPGPYTSQESIRDANELIQNLEIDSKTVFINSAYQAFVDAMKNSKEEISDLTSQNIQARCRMIILMAMSNNNK